MGWFWADEAAFAIAPTAQPPPSHRNIRRDASPPPSCPMHNASTPSDPSRLMSRPPPSSPRESGTRPDKTSACPYVPPGEAKTPSATQSSSPPATIAALNPLNYMPGDLSQSPESSSQKHALPTEREMSTIPRGADPDTASSASGATWVYPSPQQMYNALLRKGYADTPADAVPAMVAVHNFLNEGAWAEILEWERRFAPGLMHGWRTSRFGEEGSVTGAMIEPSSVEAPEYAAENQPRLLRFVGKSHALTPKAQAMQALGWVAPGTFAGPPPFDRHDWFVERRGGGGKTREVRYVIDYYSAPPEETGEPVFFLDIRPAVDGPTAAAERLIRWGRDVWWRASGGRARLSEEMR